MTIVGVARPVTICFVDFCQARERQCTCSMSIIFLDRFDMPE